MNKRNEDVIALNKILVPYMKQENVRISDLYAVTAANMETYLRDDCIHLSQDGINACAKTVEDNILAELAL